MNHSLIKLRPGTSEMDIKPPFEESGIMDDIPVSIELNKRQNRQVNAFDTVKRVGFTSKNFYENSEGASQTQKYKPNIKNRSSTLS